MASVIKLLSSVNEVLRSVRVISFFIFMFLLIVCYIYNRCKTHLRFTIAKIETGCAMNDSFPLIRFSIFLLLLKSYIYLHISLNKKEDDINFTLLGVTQSAHSLYSLRINTQTMSYNVWRQPITSPYSTVTDLARFLG